MTGTALRATRVLVTAYLGLSVLTAVAVAVLSQVNPALVNPEAWVRSIIVAATSILTFLFAVRAAKGAPRALLRLRIVLVVILVAIVGVLLFLPLPLWMRIEQGACGLLLLVAVVFAFRSPPAESAP